MRPILDLSLFNTAIMVRPFRMLTVIQLMECVRQGDWLSSIDLKDAYFHLSVIPGQSPPDGIRAHSTRGVSSSVALHGGMTVDDICTAASWSSHCSFVRFYLRDVSRLSLTHSLSVLAE